MTAEEQFLARVAARLGRREPLSAPPARPAGFARSDYGPTDPARLADRFQAEAELVGARVHRAPDPAAVAPLILALLQAEVAGGTVVCWDDPALERLGLRQPLEAAGFHLEPFGPAGVAAASQAVAGITGCDWAVAETGTLVLQSGSPHAGRPRGRVVGLLPPVHIAILHLDQLVYSMMDVFRALQGQPLGSQVIFATGPSRSADIENDLSIGVHGPGRVHVVMVGGQGA